MNTFLNDVLMQEAGEFGGEGGGGEIATDESGLETELLDSESEDDIAGSDEPSTYLRDLTEDDVYNTLTASRDFPDRISAVRDQLFGRLGPIVDRQTALEKSLGQRVTFDVDALTSALAEYDNGDLAKILGPALQQALNVNQLDETAIQPFINPAVESMRADMGRELVLSAYTPERLSAIIPDADQNGQFSPQGQLQKDFVDWYAQQGYETQNALSTFSAKYVHAMRAFEDWAQQKGEERVKAEAAKAKRMNGGRSPSAQGRADKTPGLRTKSDGFYSVFKDSG